MADRLPKFMIPLMIEPCLVQAWAFLFCWPCPWRRSWLTRLRFLLFGLAVLWLAIASAGTWARAAAWMHLAFGIMMIGTAAFSHRQFIENLRFDPFEDLLPSTTATVMGFAFSFGGIGRFLFRAVIMSGFEQTPQLFAACGL